MKQLAFVILLAACNAPAPAPTSAPAAAVGASSRTPWVKVRRPEGVALLEAPARVLVPSDANAVVTPPLRARVVRVLVQPGQRVAKGAPVVQVVMPELLTAAGQALAATERLQAWQRRREQLESVRAQGLVRLGDVVEADVQLSEARAALRLAEATLLSGGARADEAAKVLAQAGSVTLFAPIAGIVVSATGAIGETREPTAEPLVRLVGDAPSRIEARFAQPLVPGATYTFVSAGSLRRDVELAGIAPDVDAADGSLRVWFRVPRPPALAPGLAGRIEARLRPDAGAVVVPARGVRIEGNAASIVIRRGDGTSSVPVQVLSTSGVDALVEPGGSALSPDDEVAAEASLVDGDGA